MQSPHSINRRNALAGSAAALVVGTIPATADDERGVWLELWNAYEAQERRHIAATDAYYDAEWQARQQYPDQRLRLMGVILRRQPNGQEKAIFEGCISTTYHPRGHSTAESLDQYYARIGGYAGAPADLDEWREASLQDLEAWEAECRTVDARFNVPALQAAHDAEYEHYQALERAIIEKPATGLLGIAVKLAVWARTELTSTVECAGGEDHEEGQLWLAGPAVAAWHDALRLTGLPARMGMERKVSDHG